MIKVDENKFLYFVKEFKKNKSALFGFYIIVVVIIMALFSEFIAPYDPIAQDLKNTLVPPFWHEGGSLKYILGTDNFGRDILSRVIYGARVSMIIGSVSVGISLLFGILVGVTSGYFGGFVDTILMRIVDLMLSIPAILLAIVIVAILGPSLVNAMIAIGIIGIPIYSRVIRSAVLVEKNKEYVVASSINGSNSIRQMFVVILPNCTGNIIVQVTMGFGTAILEAAGLSFLGLGAQPPAAEWGSMLSDALQYIISAPWLVLYPGIAILLTVMGFNLMGDGLMDILDPKLKDK